MIPNAIHESAKPPRMAGSYGRCVTSAEPLGKVRGRVAPGPRSSGRQQVGVPPSGRKGAEGSRVQGNAKATAVCVAAMAGRTPVVAEPRRTGTLSIRAVREPQQAAA